MSAGVAPARETAQQPSATVQSILRAEEDVRRRIARDLHDGLGQSLLSMILELHAVEEASPAALRPRLRGLEEAARAALDETRCLARGLHPSVLDDLGLPAALARLADEYNRGGRFSVDIHIRPGPRLPGPVETALYRIAQEALSNVVKHAHARHVSVLLERWPGRVQLIVEDDGIGFDCDAAGGAARRRGSLGLANLRERAALLGGEATVESSPGRGTTLYVDIPVGGDNHE